MLRYAYAISFAITLSQPAAFAHDQWADGSPVPAWVKAQCCGPSEVHHLHPDQVHEITCPDGKLCFKVDGLAPLIPYAAVLPSQDGDYWGFWACVDASCIVHCFFVPMSI